MNQIDQHANPEVAKTLIATKCDLAPAVAVEDARAFAAEYGMNFLETSSLSGKNVQESFQGLTKEIIDKQNVQLRKTNIHTPGGNSKTNITDPKMSKKLSGSSENGMEKKKKCC